MTVDLDVFAHALYDLIVREKQAPAHPKTMPPPTFAGLDYDERVPWRVLVDDVIDRYLKNGGAFRHDVEPPDETTLSELLDVLEPHATARYGDSMTAMLQLLDDLREVYAYQVGGHDDQLRAVLAQVEDLDADVKRRVLLAALDSVRG